MFETWVSCMKMDAISTPNKHLSTGLITPCNDSQEALLCLKLVWSSLCFPICLQETEKVTLTFWPQTERISNQIFVSTQSGEHCLCWVINYWPFCYSYSHPAVLLSRWGYRVQAAVIDQDGGELLRGKLPGCSADLSPRPVETQNKRRPHFTHNKQKLLLGLLNAWRDSSDCLKCTLCTDYDQILILLFVDGSQFEEKGFYSDQVEKLSGNSSWIKAKVHCCHFKTIPVSTYKMLFYKHLHRGTLHNVVISA